MTSYIVKSQAVWLEAIERRIEATTAMLGSMKGVKMCGLTDILLTNIHNLRIEELAISKRFRRLLVWNLAFGKPCLHERCHSVLNLHSLLHSAHGAGTHLRRILSYGTKCQ